MYGTYLSCTHSEQMTFGLWTRVGSVNHILDGGLDPPRDGALLGSFIRHPLCNEHVQSLRPTDIRNFIQQGEASITVAIC